MSYSKELNITESLSELRRLLRDTKSFQNWQKVRCLLLLKEDRFRYRVQLAEHLCIDYSTLKRWLSRYRASGVDGLLEKRFKGGTATVITPDISAKLKEKVFDSSTPLRGYWEAVEWVKQEFDVAIHYNTLRNHLQKHYNTKLKQPRKSHYKNDEQAIEAFKKTPIITEKDR